MSLITHLLIAKVLKRFQNLIFGLCIELNAETFEGNEAIRRAYDWQWC